MDALAPNVHYQHDLSLPRVVGLYSSTAQCGKSTVAKILANEYGYDRIKFADPIKRLVTTLLEELGYGEIPRFVDGDLKEEVLPELGVTSRHLQQTIGSEWGRDCVSSSIWVDIARSKINRILDEGGRVVIDDVRFGNEFNALRRSFPDESFLAHVVRPGYRADGSHRSEGQLDQYLFDAALNNYLDTTYLEHTTRRLMDGFIKETV